MRSQGTKETQGINGNATALQHKLAAVAATAGGGPIKPCPYEYHRPSDWRLTDSPHVVCGICHPPTTGLDIRRRSEATA